jgi:hypothetical protein
MKSSEPERSMIVTETMATRPIDVRPRTASICSKMVAGVMPRPSASCMAAAITGPSAMGSEKGKPISTAAAPACSTARMVDGRASTVGCPAHRNGMRAVRPSSLSCLKCS